MKTIVITGASRGIGLAIAKKFLAEGWKVIGTSNKTPIPIKDENLISFDFDQSSSDSIKNLCQKISEVTDHIDVLVNNAGITLDWADPTIDLDKIRKTFEVNVFGVVDLTEQLLSLMKKGSHIINVDSNYGSFSFPIDDESSTGYRMSKAALNMYTRTLAFHLEEKGILVSSVDPGWVNTDMGNIGADEDYKPNREPVEVGKDVYELVSNVTETGFFWRFGEKREW